MIIEKIPFAGEIAIPENECEKQFFETFPDVFNQNDIALKIWELAWSKSRAHTLDEVEAVLKKL
jgi:hypothetical protein